MCCSAQGKICPAPRCTVAVPVSSDTYSGFAASGYGPVVLVDFGGTADKLVLPFASTDVYFETADNDGFDGDDTLIMMTSSSDSFYITAQLEPLGSQKGHIEQIQFTDGTFKIGSENPSQTLSSAKTADSPESQVAKLNEASNLDASEKDKRSKAAKKDIKESKEKKTQDLDKKLPVSGAEDKR